MDGEKRLLIAYLLAFVGGLFGLHHLYLGRTRHALLWLITGGGVGIGLLYEIVALLPTYVRECNEEPSIVLEYNRRIERRKSPAFELSRFCCKYQPDRIGYLSEICNEKLPLRILTRQPKVTHLLAKH
jgi:TM2 domain-containing membrane protein YozV